MQSKSYQIWPFNIPVGVHRNNCFMWYWLRLWLAWWFIRGVPLQLEGTFIQFPILAHSECPIHCWSTGPSHYLEGKCYNYNWPIELGEMINVSNDIQISLIHHFIYLWWFSIIRNWASWDKVHGHIILKKKYVNTRDSPTWFRHTLVVLLVQLDLWKVVIVSLLQKLQRWRMRQQEQKRSATFTQETINTQWCQKEVMWTGIHH